MISVAKRAVILIVEDELLIRLNAVEMIEEAFEVVEAASADEAIAILEGRLDIAVVFTDIQMPGSMDGMKLAAAVRHRWPPIKIVATSGQVKLGPGDLPEGARFLPKPYSPAEITKILREVIAA
jgi:CheY-like chemotaxis protein